MYNKYMSDGDDIFSDLYKPIECECENSEKRGVHEEIKKSKGLDLGRLLGGLNLEKSGIIPVVLLLLLLLDVGDDEKLIIIILAVLFGI